jgi:hypothetical protein
MHFRLPVSTVIGLLCCIVCYIAPVTFADSLLSWEKLQTYCQAADQQRQALCQGYIMGAADAGALCIPSDIQPATLQNLVQASISEGSDNPTVAIQQHLRQMFPCARPEKQPSAEQKLETETVDEPKPPHGSENWSNKQRIGK